MNKIVCLKSPYEIDFVMFVGNISYAICWDLFSIDYEIVRTLKNDQSVLTRFSLI